MQFHKPTADIFIPDGQPLEQALSRVTHLGIGAHHDDLEFMAFHGIISCFGRSDRWFGGVTCTDGATCSRKGRYADFTNEQMVAHRRGEQRQAAVVGRYAAMLQLDYTSAESKDPADLRLRGDLEAILAATRPEVVYTHNLADKHDTHTAVVVPVLEAIRALPRDQRPKAVHGCEVWRDLDWLADAAKVPHDVTGWDHFAAALNGIFDSQIGGGKRYDLAVMGRRRANATFYDAHASDSMEMLAFAMDLTPLVEDDTLDIAEFALAHIEQFKQDVSARLRRRLGR